MQNIPEYIRRAHQNNIGNTNCLVLNWHDRSFYTWRECFNNVNDRIKDIKELAPSVKAHPDEEFDNAHVLQTINPSAIASPSVRDREFANGSLGITEATSPSADSGQLDNGSARINDVAAFHANDEDKGDKFNRDPDIDTSCQAGTEPDPSGDMDAAEEDSNEDPAEYNPNYYYMRLDLFDNEDARNTSRYKAKITARYEPDDDEDEIMVVEFHNRPRDVKHFLNKNGLWDHYWYQSILS